MTFKSSEHQSIELRFSDIFKRHEYKLYTFAYQLTKSDQYAKDIVQEVFLKLWESRTQLDFIPNIDAWLYKHTESRIVHFLCKTAEDKRLRDALWANMQQMNHVDDDSLFSREYTHIIEKAIDSLPPQRKKLYRLCKEDGLNYIWKGNKSLNNDSNIFHSIHVFLRYCRYQFALVLNKYFRY